MAIHLLPKQETRVQFPPLAPDFDDFNKHSILKNMPKKKITIEDLAGMVSRGFVSVDKRFNDVDKRFDIVDKRLDHMDARMAIIERDVTEIRKHSK